MLFIHILAAATITFSLAGMQLLIKGAALTNFRLILTVPSITQKTK